MKLLAIMAAGAIAAGNLHAADFTVMVVEPGYRNIKVTPWSEQTPAERRKTEEKVDAQLLNFMKEDMYRYEHLAYIEQQNGKPTPYYGPLYQKAKQEYGKALFAFNQKYGTVEIRKALPAK